MRRFAFLITLVLMLMGSATAQFSGSGTRDPLWGTTLNIPKMTGVEVSPGTLDYVDNVCWGRTFLTMNDSGSFTFIPNYSVDFAAEPTINYSKFTGGAWTLSYKEAKQSGMVFGEIRDGEIQWHTDKGGNVLYGVFFANLEIKGGTGSFASIGAPYHYGKFTGVIDYSSGTPLIEGSLELDF